MHDDPRPSDDVGRCHLGAGNVASYLRSLDLSTFDPKAPPRQIAAFWIIVATGEAPESGELRDVLDEMENPRPSPSTS